MAGSCGGKPLPLRRRIAVCDEEGEREFRDDSTAD